jgi:hypothetical protein
MNGFLGRQGSKYLQLIWNFIFKADTQNPLMEICKLTGYKLPESPRVKTQGCQPKSVETDWNR